MRSKQAPEVIQISKKSETWNLMKTILFTMFVRGRDIRNQPNFQSTIMKNRACNPTMLFDASNHKNYEKVTPKWFQQVTKKTQKIRKNRCWDIPGPYWVHPCTQWSPKWCQTGAPRHQNASKWHPRSRNINNFECQSASKQFTILLICECRSGCEHIQFLKFFSDSYPADLSNPANPFRLQIRNLLVARGAGGRGEALRSAAPRQR